MLGYRFPIGLEEQIKKWDPETIKAFHERWYFPANATLFIVGDIGSVSRTLEMIEVCKVCCSESNASCRKKFKIRFARTGDGFSLEVEIDVAHFTKEEKET